LKSTERQKNSFSLVRRLIDCDYDFKDKGQARSFFTRLTGVYKNLNFAASGSPDYEKLLAEIHHLEANYRGEPVASA
jgi:V/A-type H+-transporting ATPase subunit A